MDMKQWVRSARTRSGKTLEQLGEGLGRTKANVHGWESGLHQPSVSQFLCIARITKMNPAELDDWPADLIVFPREELMNGWPLSPELLAALQNMDTRAARRVENTLRSMLDLPTLPTEETAAASA